MITHSGTTYNIINIFWGIKKEVLSLLRPDLLHSPSCGQSTALCDDDGTNTHVGQTSLVTRYSCLVTGDQMNIRRWLDLLCIGNKRKIKCFVLQVWWFRAPTVSFRTWQRRSGWRWWRRSDARCRLTNCWWPDRAMNVGPCACACVRPLEGQVPKVKNGAHGTTAKRLSHLLLWTQPLHHPF